MRVLLPFGGSVDGLTRAELLTFWPDADVTELSDALAAFVAGGRSLDPAHVELAMYCIVVLLEQRRMLLDGEGA